MFQLTDTGPKIKKNNSQLAINELTRSGIFFVDFNQISHIAQMFPLLTLNFPVVCRICDQNKSRAQHHRSLKLSSTLNWHLNLLENQSSPSGGTILSLYM